MFDGCVLHVFCCLWLCVVVGCWLLVAVRCCLALVGVVRCCWLSFAACDALFVLLIAGVCCALCVVWCSLCVV